MQTRAATRAAAKRAAEELNILSSTTDKHNAKSNRRAPPVPVRGGWDVLPHNLGKVSTPESKAPVTEAHALDDGTAEQPQKKRRLNGPVTGPVHEDTANHDQQKASNGEPDTADLVEHTTVNDGEGSKTSDIVKKAKRKARKTADNPYGLMPGETPYPDWHHPVAMECEVVYKILTELHGDVQPLPPAIIAAPSQEVAGCGEVPSVLDGLMRTILSQSTTFDSANNMLKSLITRFGICQQGTGKGSVHWWRVLWARPDDVYQALKAGGLGANKANNIQAILLLVYGENMQHRGGETSAVTAIVSAAEKTEEELAILRADPQDLTLDHMHGMTKNEAIRHFVRYPGVGVKTAACVVLFALQRPCFAVDTHVFRMARWLGWAPQKTNEDNVFHHLEFCCPEHLKYGLHQLFIRHGQTCYRCNDKSFVGTEEWEKSVCPLEHLVNRFTKRHAKPKETNNARIKGKKKAGNKAKSSGNSNKEEVEVEAEIDEEKADKAGTGKDKETRDIPQGSNGVRANKGRGSRSGARNTKLYSGLDELEVNTDSEVADAGDDLDDLDDLDDPDYKP